ALLRRDPDTLALRRSMRCELRSNRINSVAMPATFAGMALVGAVAVFGTLFGLESASVLTATFCIGVATAVCGKFGIDMFLDHPTTHEAEKKYLAHLDELAVDVELQRPAKYDQT